MFGKKKSQKIDESSDTQDNKFPERPRRLQERKDQPDRLREKPGDTFIDIIIFLLIIAVITGLVFVYWALTL